MHIKSKNMLRWITYNPKNNKQPMIFFCRIISSIILLFGYDKKSFNFYEKTVLKNKK